MEKSTLVAVLKKNPMYVVMAFLGLLFFLYVLFFINVTLRAMLCAAACVLLPIGGLCNAASEKVASPSTAKGLKAAYYLLYFGGYALFLVPLFIDIMVDIMP